MLSYSFLLTAGQVFLTVLIALIPFLYPKYSIYTGKSAVGVKQLFRQKQVRDELRVSHLREQETGFDEIVSALDHSGYPTPSNTVALGVAYGNNDDVIDYLETDLDLFVSHNGVLFAETDNSERVSIFYESWGRSRIERLEPVKRAVRRNAERRSHILTMFVTFMWTTITVVRVI